MSITTLRHAAVRKARLNNPDRRKSPQAWAVYKAAINRVIALYGPGPYWGSGMSAAEIKADRAAKVAAGIDIAGPWRGGGEGLTPLGGFSALGAGGGTLGGVSSTEVSTGTSAPNYLIIGAVILGLFLIFRKR